MFEVALFEPEIAGNAGAIARSCLAAGARLHLIRPLGFRLTERALARAGMDYWQQVALTVHDSYAEFRAAFAQAYAERRVYALSTKGKCCYAEVRYRPGDVLLFGPESRGLPEAVRNEATVLRIPMMPGVRSLNLAISASVVLYEAWRQQGFSPAG